MSQLLELSEGVNSLIDAYDSITRNKKLGDTAENDNSLVAVYEQYFTTVSPPISERPPVFERVSFVDPTILTFVRSNTAAL